MVKRWILPALGKTQRSPVKTLTCRSLTVVLGDGETRPSGFATVGASVTVRACWAVCVCVCTVWREAPLDELSESSRVIIFGARCYCCHVALLSACSLKTWTSSGRAHREPSLFELVGI